MTISNKNIIQVNTTNCLLDLSKRMAAFYAEQKQLIYPKCDNRARIA